MNIIINFGFSLESIEGDKCTEDDDILKFYKLNRGVGTYIGHACDMESPQNRTFLNDVRLNFISHDSSNQIQNHGGFMANVYTEGKSIKDIWGHLRSTTACDSQAKQMENEYLDTKADK